MKKAKKIISLGVSLAILVTSTSFAFAAGNRAYTPGTNKDGILKVQKLKGMERGGNIGLLSGLVTSGTITTEQQKAVQTALKSIKKSGITAREALEKLVAAGTLTQAQADAAAKAYDDAKAKLEAEKEKRLTDRAEKKGNGINTCNSVLSELVTAGAITAEQQKAVRNAMKPSKGKAVTLESALGGLVEAGTLTQAQADAITKAYNDAKAKLEDEKEKRLKELAEKKGITVEELKAQMSKGGNGTGDKSGFKAGAGQKNRKAAMR
ncbi:hypothetical protein CLHUN_33670 [Ruminiclostridium hungatei]|uniref:Uncharacterized protein n=1 Tax=Ruminiclostridium hungatei TaxID=48256 RepID=A0A1V4SGX4_RUMHU|nr:hypothetical protein [Ruminiclostridium hungatei]OPX42715.1 hypothetical protein CLHUN_33670 [Ruminiclostridium hungatei]